MIDRFVSSSLRHTETHLPGRRAKIDQVISRCLQAHQKLFCWISLHNPQLCSGPIITLKPTEMSLLDQTFRDNQRRIKPLYLVNYKLSTPPRSTASFHVSPIETHLKTNATTIFEKIKSPGVSAKDAIFIHLASVLCCILKVRVRTDSSHVIYNPRV